MTTQEGQPGHGWYTVSKVDLLASFNLPQDLTLLGVRWNPGTETLTLQLSGSAIPWQGGEIIHRNPIQTEKQQRDERVAKGAR